MTNPALDKKTVGISPIWILPIIALVICGWLMYQSIQTRGVDIIIYFNDASGITPGKTQVVSMGLPIGLVKKLYPELHKGRIKTIIEMNRDTIDTLVEDTVFWVVRPEVSAARIYGLETILSGSYIGIQPGKSNIEKKEFIGLTSPPPISDNVAGLHFTIEANSLQSIQEGSGIYYKNIEIGSIQSYQLSHEENERSAIILQAFIKKEFAHLVKPESRFFNTSGLSLSGKLPNLKLHVESLSALILGGIVLETPEEARHNPPVKSGHNFKLFENAKEANYIIPMTLTLASGEGIVEGATKVMYRGLEAGYVKKIEIHKDETHLVTAHILLDPRAKLILKEGTKFYLAGPSIRGGSLKNLQTLLSGPFITFEPGGGEFKDHFEILPEPPPVRPARPGKMYVLKSGGTKAVSIGSPVHFKGVKVGEVIDTTLRKRTAELNIIVFIYGHYLQFISDHSLFYMDQPLKINADFKGLEVESSPVSSILQGGISFYTPQEYIDDEKTSPVEYTSFILYDDRKTLPVNQQHTGDVQLQLLAESLGSISVGSPILYKKVNIGEVLSFALVKDQVLINCLIEERYRQYLHSNSLFFETSGIEVQGGVNGIDLHTGSLQSILRGGITLYNPTTSVSAAPAKEKYNLFSSFIQATTQGMKSIFVTFPQGGQLQIGASLKYKGVEIGKVVDLLVDSLPAVTAEIKVNEGMEKYCTTNAQFWLATPEINLEGINNLETILFGPYVAFKPGKGETASRFTALTKPPVSTDTTSGHGLHLVLEKKNRGSVTIGSPVLYRQIQVGRVTDYKLDESFQKVLISVIIEPDFKPIIRENTKFWQASGTTIQGGLFSGVTMKTESLEAIVRGGIALATPDNEKSGGAVTDNHRFKLYEDYKDEWLDWSPDIVILEKEKATP